MNKKILLFLLVLSFALSGCGRKNFQPQVMDQLNEEGVYPYQSDLGFSLKLPKEFEYFQVQRKKQENWTDTMFFVPTADYNFSSAQLPNYASPLTVRIFNRSYWEKTLNEEERGNYIKVGENKDKVFVFEYWTQVPNDWSSKWGDNLKNSLVKNFSVVKK